MSPSVPFGNTLRAHLRFSPDRNYTFTAPAPACRPWPANPFCRFAFFSGGTNYEDITDLSARPVHADCAACIVLAPGSSAGRSITPLRTGLRIVRLYTECRCGHGLLGNYRMAVEP
jgi:hypothetical protein